MASELLHKWRLAGGDAPDHWDFTTIESLLADSKSIAVGVMYPGKHKGDGIPLIKVADIKNGLVTGKPEYLISQEKDSEYRRTKLYGDELLITLVGNPGDCVLVTEDMAGWNVARAVAVLRLKNPELRPWVRYALLSPPAQHFLGSRFNTTVQKTLNLKDIRELFLPFPPEQDRNKITDIVDTIEKKIALNHQINTTLESMAQALFKSWFVDFDPVIDNALAASNPIPEALKARADARAALGDQRKPLPDHIRQQFPDRFVQTEEMGWVPEGWQVGPVSSIAVLNPEAWTAKNYPDKVRYLDLSNTKNGRITDTETYSFSDAPSRARRVLRPNDTIIGTVRPGNRAFAFIQVPGLTGSTGFAVIRPQEQNQKCFIYYALTRKEAIDWFAHIADGGAYPAIRPNVISEQLVTIPPENILTHFDSIVSPCLKSVGRNEMENRTLSDLRDTLLPKLLSGELRVPEAVRQIEEFI